MLLLISAVDLVGAKSMAEVPGRPEDRVVQNECSGFRWAIETIG